MSPIGIIIAIVLAAVAYIVFTPLLGLPQIVGIIAALVVLVAGVMTGGFGLGARFGGAGAKRA